VLTGSASGGACSSAGGDCADACIFWCAVALGALLQGVQDDTVKHFMRLAAAAAEKDAAAAAAAAAGAPVSCCGGAGGPLTPAAQIKRVQAALMRACVFDYTGNAHGNIACVNDAVRIWNEVVGACGSSIFKDTRKHICGEGASAADSENNLHGIDFVLQFLNRQIQFREEVCVMLQLLLLLLQMLYHC
jgi:hypothetical protein